MTDDAPRAPSSTPGWQCLTGLVTAVVVAHALVLQAAPIHLTSSQEAGNQAFVTRNIEAVTTPTPGTTPSPAPVRTPAKPVKTVQNSPKNESIRPLAQQIRAQTAIESIASTEPLPEQPGAAQTPTESSASATPTVVAASASASGSSSDSKAQPVTAITLPGSVRMQYKVVGLSKNLNYQASAELNWKTDGDSYDALMKVSAFLVGSRSMSSVGKVTASGLAPTRFADKFRSELAAHFEAEKGKIIFSANTPDVPWTAGVQDRLSVFLQLAGMLAANPTSYPTGSNVSFLTIGPRDADTWTFVVETEETLDLMNAPIAALRLIRKPRKEFDQKVELWLAPSLGYLPVRIRVTQHDGDYIDQQLTQVNKSL